MSRKKQDGGNQDKQRAKGFCSAMEPPAEEVSEVEELIRLMREDPIAALGPELGARQLERLKRLQAEREGQYTVPNVSLHREFDERAPNRANAHDDSYLNLD